MLKRVLGKPLAPAATIAVLTLLAAGLRVPVATQDLFADELATYWVVSSNGFGGVISTVDTAAEISPPLSFLLSWLSTRIELTPELLRLPALLAGVASVPLVYLVGRGTVGRGAALLAAALTAFSPFMIFYSAEARGYGLMMALVLLSTLALLRAVDGGGRRWWAAYALFTAATVYTHYTAVFVLATQFVWVLVVHPGIRRAACVATGAAALAFLPWLPSLKGDLDSPTTAILAAFSPFNFDTVRISLEHWSLGFPYAIYAPLTDLPGVPALILIAASIVVVAAGVLRSRGRARERLEARDRRLLLVLALAAATPVGTACASLIGTDVFGTRNLAASWPYLALAGAALVTLGRQPFRALAAGLALIAFAIGAAKTLGTDYQRPKFEDVAQFIEEDPPGAVVDSAALTPGPLANLDLLLDRRIPLFRANVPEQDERPFDLTDRLPELANLAGRAVAAAEGGPIVVVTTLSGNRVAGLPADDERAAAFIDELPGDYRLVERRIFPSFLDLQALVYARDALSPRSPLGPPARAPRGRSPRTR